MNICFFCERQKSEPGNSIHQPLYKLSRYRHLGIIRRFEYSKVIVNIDRCPICAEKHLKLKRNNKKVIIFGSLSGIIIGLLIPFAILYLIIAGGFLGYLLALKHEQRYLKKLHIKRYNITTISTYPEIIPLLQNGWGLKEP